MAYMLERFGSITLPGYNRIVDMAPAPARDVVAPTVSGPHDWTQGGRAPLRLANPVVMESVAVETSAETLRTAVDALRAAVGTRNWLYRRGQDDGAVQRCAARLVAMDMETQPRDNVHGLVKLRWVQLTPWTGRRVELDWEFDDGHYFDDGLYFDSAGGAALEPGDNTLTLLGNLSVTDAQLYILCSPTSSPGAMSVRVQNVAAGCDFTVAATMQTGWWFSIDCGARTVTINDTTPAYSAFSLGAGHSNTNWLELTPGANTVALTITGGTEETTITYAEAWA